MEDLSKECHELSLGVAQFILDWLHLKNDFECRSFYGESFSINLLQRHQLLTSSLKNKLVTAYQKKNKSDPEFHHEFNNYAFSDYYWNTRDESIRNLYCPLIFKNTQCTNWTLLRSVVKLREKVEVESGLREVDLKIKQFQLPSGLILDDPGVHSFQYHCFSASLILELYKLTGNEKYKKSFLGAVSFIRHFILPNGDTLYIGRGQEQSFGLSVLVYILAEAHQMTEDQALLEEIEIVLKFLKKFKRNDGSFPLVFSGVEKRIPTIVDMFDEEFCGWYPYNNYFDYLPFMGVYLHKASLVLGQTQLADNYSTSSQTSYIDSYFIKIVRTRYIAILSKPGGYWTNDLSFPLVFFKNEALTPMLGGEQFQKSLYSEEMLSFPVTIWKRLSWRKYGRGFWLGNRLIWISCFGLFARSFVFNEDNIIIKNRFYSWLRSEELYSLKVSSKLIGQTSIGDKKFLLKFDKPILAVTEGYSASGKLNIYSVVQNSTITMELL